MNDWIARFADAASGLDEAVVIGEILTAESETDLLSLVNDDQAPTTLRCAALDRLGQLESGLLPHTVNQITGRQQDHPEELVAAAFRWRMAIVSLPDAQGQGMTLGQTDGADDDWRQEAEKSRSPRIRWLSSLGQ